MMRLLKNGFFEHFMTFVMKFCCCCFQTHINMQWQSGISSWMEKLILRAVKNVWSIEKSTPQLKSPHQKVNMEAHSFTHSHHNLSRMSIFFRGKFTLFYSRIYFFFEKGSQRRKNEWASINKSIIINHTTWLPHNAVMEVYEYVLWCCFR